MSSYILCKFGGFSKGISPKLFGISGSNRHDNWNCYALSIFRNFILLSSSDNDKPMLMRQKCKQGFAYIFVGRNTRSWQKHTYTSIPFYHSLELSPLSPPFLIKHRFVVHLTDYWASKPLPGQLSSVGRAPGCWVGGRGFKPRSDQQPGSLIKWWGRVGCDMRACLSSDDRVIGRWR